MTEIVEIISQEVLVFEDGGDVLVIESGETEILELAEQGAPGRDGIDGSSAGYAHAQAVPAAVWTANHGMGKHPAVAVVDSAGGTVYGDIRYLDANTVEITFSGAFAGFAYFN